MLAVPFENLDIALGRKIVLTEDALFSKIIDQHRGGFCCELNGTKRRKGSQGDLRRLQFVEIVKFTVILACVSTACVPS